jgi:glutaredoxin 3
MTMISHSIRSLPIAKAILDEKGARYTVVELDKESDGKAVRAEMGQMLGRTSVPAIW